MVTEIYNPEPGTWAIRRRILYSITNEAIMIVANQWSDIILSGPYHTIVSFKSTREISNHIFGSEIRIKPLNRW